MSGTMRQTPELSLVVPCYNEADCLNDTMPPLVAAFAKDGVALELILVDNGSTDKTSAAIDSLIAAGLPITKAIVPVNMGQGLGILTGLRAASGNYVGYVNADGQIPPEDVARVYAATRDAPADALVKARRLNRPDGFVRAAISMVYNATMQILFRGVPSRDVNCNPKILTARVFRLMDLGSYDWFLEAEVMLKARYLRIPVVEVEVVSRPRHGGRSHVRFATVLEFMWNLAVFRLRGPWRQWRRQVSRVAAVEAR